MPGIMLNERVAGIPNGFPAESDGSLKVRFVAPTVFNMADRSADLLKMFGGIESFSFDNTKVEWTEDDIWNRRLVHGGLANGAATDLTVTGQAHRYPVGTILLNMTTDEYVRIVAHIDEDTIKLRRDIFNTVTEGAWANTDEVMVAGHSMHENDNWTFRPTSIMSQPYNHPQIFQTGVQATFRRLETKFYGLPGSDLDKQAQDTVEEQYVYMETAALHGYRFAGTADVPSAMGGVKFYVTDANGSVVTDLQGSPLTRADIEDVLERLAYSVGTEKMAKTILTSYWGARKISSFYAGAEYKASQASGPAGVIVDQLYTHFGTVNVLTNIDLAKNDMYLLNTANIKIGYHGNLGRPKLINLPPSSVGPRQQRVFYGDISMTVGGVEGMARIHNFHTSA